MMDDKGMVVVIAGRGIVMMVMDGENIMVMVKHDEYGGDIVVVIVVVVVMVPVIGDG